MSARRELHFLREYFLKKDLNSNDTVDKNRLTISNFPSARRTSDPSSESGSDDIHQLDIGEDQSSSISGSSSESCHSQMSDSHQRQPLKIETIRSSRSSLNKMQIFDNTLYHDDAQHDDHLKRNGSLSEHRTRISKSSASKTDTREKVEKPNHKSFEKNHIVSDNENLCEDSSKVNKLEQHRSFRKPILSKSKSARQLREDSYESSKERNDERSYKHEQQQQEIDGHPCDNLRRTEETLHKLCLRRQEELRLASLVKRSSLDCEDREAFPHLQRSSTDSFGQLHHMTQDDCHHESFRCKAKRIFSSPRISRKAHAHVLRAASSIPSLIFPLGKSHKSKNAASSDIMTSSYSSITDTLSKKSDDLPFSNSNKTRRSPLRILGNFVDDKLFRGRWGSTRRAKSTVDLGRLAWEIPDDLTDNCSLDGSYKGKDSAKDTESNIKSSRRLTMPETSKVSRNNTVVGEKKKIRKQRSMSTSASERIRNKESSDTLSTSSLTMTDTINTFHAPKEPRTEISADAIAEIEAFERLAQSLLSDGQSN